MVTRDIATSENENILPSSYRRDIMTYRLPIDSLSEQDDFFLNEKARYHTATFRMNEHDWKHRVSCFKHGLECRFCFPQPSCEHPKFIEDDDDFTEIKWSYIDENKECEIVYPYTIESKRPVGSEYLNTHSCHITKKFGCNSNIQIGSPRCVFYVLHYATKSTQKEDRGVDFDKIGYQVIRRIIKEKARIEREMEIKRMENNGEYDSVNNGHEDENYCFREGLSRFLIGMSVHLSSDVISATMAHLLISQKGSRFTFSHQFRDVLVSQMLNHLNGDEIADFVLRRRNRGKDQELVIWADYSINDYLHRPDCLGNMSFYEFSTKFEKKPFSFNQMKQLDENGLPLLREGEMHFKEDHPGRRYCYLKKSSKLTIPKLSTPKGMLCDLDHLELGETDVGAETKLLRIDYAKIALILFYPFRGTEIFDTLVDDDDLWAKFQRLKNETNEGLFWRNGIEILQNMQDIKQSGKCKIPADSLNSSTIQKVYVGVEEKEEKNPSNYDSDNDGEYIAAMGIGEYSMGEGYEYSEDLRQECIIERSLDLLMHGQKPVPDYIMKSRMITNSTLFPSNEKNDNGTKTEKKDESSKNAINPTENTTKLGTLLGFVTGSMIGKIRDESDNLNFMPNENLNASFLDDESNKFLSQIDWVSLGFDYNLHRDNIPTMQGVAEKALLEGNISLDSIQYTAYETICSSFLLEVIGTEWKKQVSVLDDESVDSKKLRETHQFTVENLKKLGAKDQLIMFITGPAGAGKSTSISIAEKYCYEFCKAVGIAWKDETFLFTAMTGVAAALFGGLTLHSVVYFNTEEDKISLESMNLWKDVKILIIDEISMATVEMINKLNQRLNKFRREVAYKYHDLPTNMIFGGYSIIFCGDFRQIPPVCAKDHQLLYKNPGLWENSINVAIILQNSHRFKDDPGYGEMMMRIWKGEFSEEDIRRINERVIGKNNIKFPEITPDTDISYACHRNKDRNVIHAASFKKHIENFPPTENDELPPDHTIIVEADIQDAPKYKPRKKKKKKGKKVLMMTKMRMTISLL